MADDAYEYVNCDRRKQRQNVKAFASLIATPATGAFTMPAGARISFVATAGAAAGDTLATFVGTSNRTIKARLLVANGRQILDYAERGVVITPSTNVDVYVDQGLARWAKIAGGLLGGSDGFTTQGGDRFVTQGGDRLIIQG